MQMKYIVSLSIFLLLSIFSILNFSTLSTGSGSGSMNSPSMVFKEWRVGRGVRGNTLSVPIHRTFITSTETSCSVSASVGYNGNQPKNTAPINPNTVSWSFSANHGIELDEDSIRTSWSGPHPSKLSGYTSFNVVAQLDVPSHDDTSQYANPNRIPAICTDARNADRDDRTPRHRGGTRMTITITFTAQTTQGNTVTKSVTLNQDETDQIRQEYLDLGRQIPGRGSFSPEDFYDFGHYDQMINDDLQTKHDAWVTAINERERQNLPDLTRDQLVVTSGYRNPHHNVYHAEASAVHGLHQYGLALDVRGMNIDGIPGNDQAKMRLAALNADPAASRSYLYSTDSTGHVHADWRGSPWPPTDPIPPAPTFALPAQSTNTQILGNTNNSGNVSPTPSMHSCGIHATSVSGNHSRITPACGDSAHAGYACQISSDHNTEMPGWSGPFYECQPHTTYPCGHKDPNANSAYHAYGTFPCGISTHMGYLCTAAAASDALNHTLQASCSLTNANGDSCALTNFYACQSHTCVYSCGRSACTQTVSSSTQHSATCASGHSYWTCNPSDVSLHITRTCRLTTCGKSWERCSTPGGTPLCDDPWRRSQGLPCWKK